MLTVFAISFFNLSKSKICYSILVFCQISITTIKHDRFAT